MLIYELLNIIFYRFWLFKNFFTILPPVNLIRPEKIFKFFVFKFQAVQIALAIIGKNTIRVINIVNVSSEKLSYDSQFLMDFNHVLVKLSLEEKIISNFLLCSFYLSCAKVFRISNFDKIRLVTRQYLIENWISWFF